MPKDFITQDELKSVLRYDPETGLFTWIKQLSSRGVLGSVAGCGSRYWEIRINGQGYLAHRLAYLYMVGDWPDGTIDHINRCRHDNRWCNLRLATHLEQQHNLSRHIDNRSGYMGVTLRIDQPRKKKWRADIRANGRNITIGTYATPEEAHAAYIAKKQELHPSWPSNHAFNL